MQLSIGKVVALYTALVAGAGLVIAGTMALGNSYLVHEQSLVTLDAGYMSDRQRLEDSLRQWLLMGDLIHGSGQTYLIEGAASQGEHARSHLASLRASPFGEDTAASLDALSVILDRDAVRLMDAANLAPEAEATRASELLAAWDADAVDAIASMQSLGETIDSMAGARQASFDSMRARVRMFGLLGLASYLALVLSLWAWLRSYLVRPLAQLTAAADEAVQSDAPLRLDEIGPTEVRQLTRSAAAFAGQLRRRVDERTQELREREADLVAEVAFRKSAQQAAADALREAEKASRAKSEFLANMSHEIRTPLNGILGSTELAIQDATTREQKDLLEAVHASGHHLLHVINDVLDFSKLEAGHLQLSPAPFDIFEMVGDVARLFAPGAAEKEIELIISLDPALPRMLVGDGTRLRQVLSNLVNNAVKFTDFGEVAIEVELLSASHSDLRLRFSVRDTGIGVPLVQQEAIFEAFRQADGSASRKWDGTGLGLSICQRFIDLMEGEIGLTSTPGEGSTFWYVVELVSASVPEAAPPEISPDLRTARVHVANATLAKGLTRQLEDWGLCLVGHADESADVVVIDTEHVKDADLDTEPRPRRIIELRRCDQPASPRSRPGWYVIARPCTPDALACLLARQAPTGIATEQANVAPFENTRVLVVEDNRTNQLVARKMLERLGCVVTLAASGQEGIEAIRGEPYDLVFMDWHMPGMNGLEATCEVRAWEVAEARERMPIIALTANAMDGDANRCLDAGMDGYLAKPVNMDGLASVLAEYEVH